eukprot:31247_1
MAEAEEERMRFTIWVILVFTSYILAIAQLYGIHRLYSIKNLLIVQKRYPQIVFLEAILCTIYLFISMPFLHQDLLRLKCFGSYQSTLMSITYTTYAYLSHCIVNAEAARLWLIYFDLNYLNALKNQAWKSIINIKQKDQDWFLRNKQTYGNKKWIISRILIYYFISATISCIVLNLFGAFHVTYLIDGCLYGLPLIIIVYVYLKSPRYSKDYFYFRHEFKISALLVCYTLCVYLFAQIVFFYNIFVSDLMTVSVSLNTSILSLISTIWIPYKILSKTIWNQHTNSTQRQSEIVMKVIQTPSTIKTESSSTNSKLLQTLKNEHDLESFVDHISHEFSCEVILSFIECCQFKKYFTKIYNGQYDDNSTDDAKFERFENSRSYSYEMNASVPKSSIVYGVVDVDKPFDNQKHLIVHIKNSAYLLYKKYVCVGAELEINISSGLRNYYFDMMNNYDHWMKNDKMELNELI